MKNIKYICFYNYKSDKEFRESVQSASSKIDYIIDVLIRLGYSVDIISKSSVSLNSFSPSLGGKIILKKNKTLRHFFSLGCRNNLFIYIINRILNSIHFFIWLIFHLEKKEKVIVYHSLGYTFTFLLLKKIKGIEIIGEIEEIYQNVHKQMKLTSKNEYKFIQNCDKYIFSTELLNDKLNKNGKPYIVIHGLYQNEIVTHSKFNDGKTHVVYGGTLDPQKGGAVAALESAEFLPENYHVHICGFGNSLKIKNQIKTIAERSLATLTFEGELKGEDYKNFIQKCHIGLSTQNPSAAFNDTSFPSKILVYLANGLKVVSIRISVVEKSALSDLVFFYDTQTPNDLAKAIISANQGGQVDGISILKELDKNFELNLCNT